MLRPLAVDSTFLGFGLGLCSSMVPDHRLASALALRSVAFHLLLPSHHFGSTLQFCLHLAGQRSLGRRGIGRLQLQLLVSLAAWEAGGALTSVTDSAVATDIMVHCSQFTPKVNCNILRLSGRSAHTTACAGELGLSGARCQVCTNFGRARATMAWARESLTFLDHV